MSILLIGAYGLGLAAGEAAVAWSTSNLNGWLLRPETIVLGGGGALAIGWVLYAGLKRSRIGVAAASTTVILTLVVNVLAYCFALPLKMLEASAMAERAARSLISMQGGWPPQYCSHSHADLRPVSPIIHAFEACATTPTVALVSYRNGQNSLYYGPSGPQSRQGARVTFWPDSCVRHLYGPWWALHTYNPDSTAMGGGRACPMGYSFIGGP